MKEIKEIKRVKLISNHIGTFRHGIETPIIIGVAMITPEGLTKPRLCFEVCYPSDGFIDFVAFSNVNDGFWRFEDAN